ncbi:polysaccharide biosynthesis protein [Anditalea andensis]|uniref:Polysaccharide biosynthesis protein CapD-like domain-containing protein n=1 Tax=Anditalea andensis TaxID=1048983 RepID=A0A074LGB1_9BACT|nr:polysaccharide biosynthesis protein [Anditalea andensis]KEO72832.1 hypothetical protein EL17_14490 [Anditalea andensis]
MIKSSLNVLPGWMVLLVDFAIFLHAGILSYLIVGNFNLGDFFSSGFLLGSSLFALMATIVSFVFKNHLISSEENILSEIFSSIKVLMLAISLFLFFHFISKAYVDYPLFSGEFSFMAMLLGFTLFGLLFFRLAIRQAIDYLNNQDSIQHKFLIIENPSHSSIARRTLQKLGFPLHLIKAYVSEFPVRPSQKILGAPIYESTMEIKNIVGKHDITDIILGPNLKSSEKRSFIDQSISAGIRPSIVKIKDPWTLNSVGSLGIKKVVVEDYLAEDQIILNDRHLYQYINQQTILLAGAAGNLGQEICRQLLFLNPAHLILIDQDEEGLAALENRIQTLQLNTTITPVIADIRNKSRIRTVFEEFRPDLVYNAALFSETSFMEVYSDEALQIHIMGTKNLVDLSEDFEVSRFIQVSAEQAVAPREVTAASKRLAEMYVQHVNARKSFSVKKTKFIIIRHGNILGLNDNEIHSIRKDIKSGKPVLIHHPKTSKSFYSLAETVKFILTSSILGQGGETYVMDKKNSITLVDLVHKIVKLSGENITSELRVHYNKNIRPIESPTTYNKNSEYLLPTTHEDIFLAVPLKSNFEGIEEKIEQLDYILQQNNPITLIKYFKSIIPDFVSNNKFIELNERSN